MSKIYYDTDADLDVLKDKTIAILGYGNQGRAQAFNMRDSGIKNLIVGSRQDDSHRQAQEDGFPVFSIAEASKRADILFMLLPDEIAPELFREQIEPHLEPGNVLNFASGYNITFHKIQPPPFVDVIMAAPRMIGKGVRELFESGEGFPTFVGVSQDASGIARQYAVALCKAIGSTKKGAIEVTFDDETFLDLMAEQGIWPIIYNVFVEAFRLQVAMGHPEEAVLTELYLSKEPVVMMEKAAEVGFFRQLPYHSHTSQFGQLMGYTAVDTAPIQAFLKKQYQQIRSGAFAEKWEHEQQVNHLSTLEKLERDALQCDLTKAEDRLKARLK